MKPNFITTIRKSTRPTKAVTSINTPNAAKPVIRRGKRAPTVYTLSSGKDFLVDNAPNARQNNPNGYFTKDKPGEYTVKIYYNGEPVRETKFTIDAKGWIARNAFSEQIFLNDHRVVVPVKIVGNMEKWNAATWKTDAFYGNPLNGFVAP